MTPMQRDEREVVILKKDRERPTIALAREIAGWDQNNPATTKIPHWAVNLAAHLLDKGFRRPRTVETVERTRIAREEAERRYPLEAYPVSFRHVPAYREAFESGVAWAATLYEPEEATDV